MKTMLCAISVLLLCSCATAPSSLQTSYNGHSFASGPTSPNDPRLLSPQYYMDDDRSPVLPESAPQSFQFRALDGFCNANCQASRR
jgi:hypothetical protein